MESKNLVLKIALGVFVGWISITVVGSVAKEFWIASQDQGGAARETANEIQRLNDEYDQKAERGRKLCAEGNTYFCK